MYDDNAVSGIVEDTSHAVMISRLARRIGPLCRRCGVRLTGYSKSNDVRRYAVTVALSAQRTVYTNLIHSLNRSAELQSELHTALINIAFGHATCHRY